MSDDEKRRRVIAELERILVASAWLFNPVQKLMREKRPSVEEFSTALEEVMRRVKQFENDTLRLAFLVGNREAVRHINTARNVRAAFERQDGEGT